MSDNNKKNHNYCDFCVYVLLFKYNGKCYHSVLLCSSATETESGKQVAIKKLARPFQTNVHAKRTYREIHMLKHMNHENVSILCGVCSDFISKITEQGNGCTMQLFHIRIGSFLISVTFSRHV